ncbi:MAG: hypothetical protein HOM11_01825 [Methylococcales bacterium]|jgi:hypothetical protein|nr:hypothetical protein [Methylococcales bacterium]MBT7446035.1 hypothetical protein [Methylococcales bacterium]
MKRYKHNGHSLQDTGFSWTCSSCKKQWANPPSSNCSNNPAQPHQLEQAPSQFFCEKCEQHWHKKPTTRCPGLPFFEQATPYALCYDEKVYPETITPYIDLTLIKDAHPTAVTGSLQRLVPLYTEDQFTCLPSTRLKNRSRSFRLKLVEAYLKGKQDTSTQVYTTTVDHCIITWNMTAEALPLLLTGQKYSLEERGHLFYYQDKEVLTAELTPFIIARKLMAANPGTVK